MFLTTMKYSLLNLICIISGLFISCKASAPPSENKIYTFINETYSGKENLYFKTFQNSELNKFVEKVDLRLWNNNLSKGLITGEEVNYNDIFREEDLNLISKQLEKQEQVKLDSKFLKVKDILVRSKSAGVHQISQPIYNKNKTISLIFRKKFNGGEDIVVYESVNNEWRVHSVITLSMV